MQCAMMKQWVIVTNLEESAWSVNAYANRVTYLAVCKRGAEATSQNELSGDVCTSSG